MRLCALLGRNRQLPDTLVSHVKELALEEDDELVSMIQTTVESRLTEELRLLALKRAKKGVDEIFVKETLEETHMLASIGTARLVNTAAYDGQALVYGEVEFDPFVEILEESCKGLQKMNKFVDLGHGIGRATIIARLTTDFEHITGYEVIENLFHKSVRLLERYGDLYGKHNLAQFTYECASFLLPEHVQNWLDADLVFANSTCFPDSLLEEIEELAKGLRPGARIVTFTSRLQNTEHFALVYRKRLLMSWGYATVFIHEKLPTGGSGVSPAEEVRREARERMESLLSDLDYVDDE